MFFLEAYFGAKETVLKIVLNGLAHSGIGEKTLWIVTNMGITFCVCGV